MNITNFQKLLIVIILILFSFGLAFSVQAQDDGWDYYIVPKDCRGEATLAQCGLSQVEETALNIAQIILGLSGSLALLMFVYGGVLYIMAGGKEDYVSKAKNAIVYAIIGLVIILSSGVILKFVVQALTG